MVDYAPFSGDYRNTRVTNNRFKADGNAFKIGIAVGPAIWGDDVTNVRPPLARRRGGPKLTWPLNPSVHPQVNVGGVSVALETLSTANVLTRRHRPAADRNRQRLQRTRQYLWRRRLWSVFARSLAAATTL